MAKTTTVPSEKFPWNQSAAPRNCAIARRAHPTTRKNGALLALSNALADSPLTVLEALAETILEVCQSGSAGISLLTNEDGGKRFYWPAIAGKWKAHIGGGAARDFGPCGDVLDRDTTLLFSHIERRYTYFQPVTPLVEEALLVPFYVAGKAVGTIWAVTHDPRRKFDAEDDAREHCGSLRSGCCNLKTRNGVDLPAIFTTALATLDQLENES